jgi:hypothetical protein
MGIKDEEAVPLRAPTRAIPRGGRVDITRLKAFAARLPRDSALRELLLTEKDELEARDFLSRMSLWLRLASRESS